MKITRFGHSCLLVETDKANVLLDPGVYSSVPEKLPPLSAILISHEHQDHIEPVLVKKILQQHSSAQVYTNVGVGKLLTEHGIMFNEVTDDQTLNFNGLLVEIMGRDHSIIYPSIPAVLNSCFFIDNNLFFPGDSFTLPNKPVKTLALPAGAPWMKVAESLDYAQTVKPELAFPIHDAIFSDLDFAHRWFLTILPPAGIPYKSVKNGESLEV